MFFFIEMGQGIIALPDMVVSTSLLSSCTMIAGRVRPQDDGGAFHYPAKALIRNDREAVGDLGKWAAALMPKEIILAFAVPLAPGMPGTEPEDQAALIKWAVSVTGTQPKIARGNNVAVEHLQDGTFAAGNRVDLTSVFDGVRKPANVTNRGAGSYTEHGCFTLVGRNRQVV